MFLLCWSVVLWVHTFEVFTSLFDWWKDLFPLPLHLGEYSGYTSFHKERNKCIIDWSGSSHTWLRFNHLHCVHNTAFITWFNWDLLHTSQTITEINYSTFEFGFFFLFFNHSCIILFKWEFSRGEAQFSSHFLGV